MKSPILTALLVAFLLFCIDKPSGEGFDVLFEKGPVFRIKGL